MYALSIDIYIYIDIAIMLRDPYVYIYTYVSVLPSLVGCSDLVFRFLIDYPYTCACVIRTIFKYKSYTAFSIHSVGGVIQRLFKFELLFFLIKF